MPCAVVRGFRRPGNHRGIGCVTPFKEATLEHGRAAVDKEG
jgi:hypothetical protein